MRAVVVRRYGRSDVMCVANLPMPVAGAGESLIRVHAAGVNPVDWKLRAGKTWPVLRLKFPSQLGFEFAGEEVGTGARVFGAVDPSTGKTGAYAEYLAASTNALIPIPAALSMAEAATLPIAGVAAWMSVHELGRLEAGHKLLVLGASGGVGTMLVQLAKHVGSHVVGVCSSRHLDLIRSLGCTRVIDYRHTDPLEGDEKYDVIVDCVGVYPRRRLLHRLTPRGVFVAVVPSPRTLLAALWPGRRKTRVVIGRPTLARLHAVTDCVLAGALRPVLGHRFALDDIVLAHQLSESGKATGKIVLDIA